jgi:hypothetical protein
MKYKVSFEAKLVSTWSGELDVEAESEKEAKAKVRARLKEEKDEEIYQNWDSPLHWSDRGMELQQRPRVTHTMVYGPCPCCKDKGPEASDRGHKDFCNYCMGDRVAFRLTKS